MTVGKKTGGRVAGTPNKTTASVKAALELCYEEIGGDLAFAAWARTEQTEFYKLYVKMLPQDIKAEIAGKDGGPLMPVINVTVTRSEG